MNAFIAISGGLERPALLFIGVFPATLKGSLYPGLPARQTCLACPASLRRERVRLERRIDPDRLARHLLGRPAVDRPREMMRQLNAVHRLVVVDEERDVDR